MSLPRFVLLDNSLIEVGGHFLKHAVCLLKAAALADLQPVLATNRAFEQREAVPPGWLVYPIFRYTALDPYSSFSAQPEKGIAAQSRPGLTLFLKHFCMAGTSWTPRFRGGARGRSPPAGSLGSPEAKRLDLGRAWEAILTLGGGRQRIGSLRRSLVCRWTTN